MDTTSRLAPRTRKRTALWQLVWGLVFIGFGFASAAAIAQPATEAQPADVADAAESTTASPPEPLEISPETRQVLTKKHPEGVAELRAIQTQVGRVVERVLPATVGIQIGASAGSGVIVSQDGLVLTAGHVSGRPGRTAVVILVDGRRLRARTLGMNANIDSGMMKIEEGGPFPYVTLAKGGSVVPGQWVVSTGHPGGYKRNRTPPIRLGRVLFENESAICTDCTLVGGDSGGPLFNMRGEVVGIHSRIGRQIRSNFHVPIATYHDTWDRLAGGEAWGSGFDAEEPARMRPMLGAAGTPDESPCQIKQVFSGMPADRAGIRVGDVIETFDGEPVENFGNLARLVLSRRIGQRIPVEIVRGEERLSLLVVLSGSARPMPGGSDLDHNKLREEEEARRKKARPHRGEEPGHDGGAPSESNDPDQGDNDRKRGDKETPENNGNENNGNEDNGNKGNRNKGKGNKDKGNKDEGKKDKTDKQRENRSDRNQGGASEGDSDNDNASNGDADKGDAEKGDAEKGDAEKGDAEKGDAGKGDGKDRDDSQDQGGSGPDASNGEASPPAGGPDAGDATPEASEETPGEAPDTSRPPATHGSPEQQESTASDPAAVGSLATLGIGLDPIAIRPVVSRVAEGSPAERSGIVAGDVLLKWGEADVANAASFAEGGLLDAASAPPPTVTVLRGNRRLRIDLLKTPAGSAQR